MDINFKMRQMKTKQYHTNLKTVFSKYQYSKLTLDNENHKLNGAVVCLCVLMQGKRILTLK